ncbi:glycoside hydrolase family 18 protein [Effusibacillus consociatus]|uniref:Glycoside hydrolase family 18 protein n=1 Tax=Effusibacillus consociatus TaxID=1117041 RepID=A0ABV9PYK9_9BACL
MRIHVVKRGDTIWSLARQYRTAVEDIIRLSEPPNPASLVVGQTLLIPTAERIHIVKAGDTFYKLGQQYGVSPQRIAQANPGVNPNALRVGQRIIIPEVTAPKRTIEVNAYIEPKGLQADREILADVAPYLTYVSVFSYRATREGGLTAPNDSVVLQAARDFRIAPLLVMTNFDGTNFNTEIARTVIRNPDVKNRLFDNLVQTIRQKGFVGVNIDFERVGPEDREAYNQFLRDLEARLDTVGASLSTALAPKEADWTTGAWHGAHDYRAHGAIVDFTVIMTYEWGWSGGPPYAVAPINKMRDVLRYAVSVIPSNKILMGFPLYGYDWTLPFVKGTWARGISPQGAIIQADRENVDIQYNETLEAPFYRYYDNQRRQHEVWFEDARSVVAKLDLINEFNLRGISYWVLGNDFPQNWVLLADTFTIRKLR